MKGTDRFSPGIPVCSEASERRFLARVLVGDPPFFYVLIPSLRLSCTADTDRRSPYGGMSIGVHRDLLCFLKAAIFWCVRSDLPTT